MEPTDYIDDDVIEGAAKLAGLFPIEVHIELPDDTLISRFFVSKGVLCDAEALAESMSDQAETWSEEIRGYFDGRP